MWSRLLYRFFALTGFLLSRLLAATVRFQFTNKSVLDQAYRQHGRVIYALWHNQLFLMPYIYRFLIKGPGLAVIVSRSSDGDIIADVLQRYHIDSMRGSSSKHGDTAFREIVQYVTSGRDAAITPDGPRGPAHTIKPGIIKLAQMTGIPIIPISCSYTKCTQLSSWDQFIIPWPFTRGIIHLGQPVYIEKDVPPPVFEQKKQDIKKVLEV